MEGVSIARSTRPHTHAQNADSRGHRCCKMGEVLASLRILPEDSETDITKLSSDIRKSLDSICSINRLTQEEIGFGLEAVILEVIVPDEEGKLSAIEETLSKIAGVSQVDTQNVSLI